MHEEDTLSAVGIIKICGVTSPEDANLAIQAGADWIGINMWAKSPRGVDVTTAAQMAAVIRERAKVVLVAVEASEHDFIDWMHEIDPDWIQIYAQYDDTMRKAAKGRVFSAVGVAEQAHVTTAVDAAGPFVLVDAHDVKQYGGTGKRIENSLAQQVCLARPTIVAGGLNSSNVSEVIHAMKPYGVDVASGVESSPGVKDMEMMSAFVAAARQAFNELH